MDDPSKQREKRIKTIKTCAILLIGYGCFACLFFGLNALDIINIFDVEGYELNRLVELSSIGTCIFGIFTGIYCLYKIESPEWYGRLSTLFFCAVILNMFIIVGYGASYGSYIMIAVIFGEILLECICATVLNKIKKDDSKLS